MNGCARGVCASACVRSSDCPKNSRARIASGLTQEAMAQKLGLKRQQIQRYEATEYASASLATIRQIAQAIESAASV